MGKLDARRDDNDNARLPIGQVRVSRYSVIAAVLWFVICVP
jgi:hypothetical protein